MSCIYLSETFKAYPQVTSAREVLSVLVERNCHDAVCGVEGLLHTIAMMDVNINVQNSLVVSVERRQMSEVLQLFVGLWKYSRVYEILI